MRLHCDGVNFMHISKLRKHREAVFNEENSLLLRYNMAYSVPYKLYHLNWQKVIQRICLTLNAPVIVGGRMYDGQWRILKLVKGDEMRSLGRSPSHWRIFVI